MEAIWCSMNKKEIWATLSLLVSVGVGSRDTKGIGSVATTLPDSEALEKRFQTFNDISVKQLVDFLVDFYLQVCLFNYDNFWFAEAINHFAFEEDIVLYNLAGKPIWFNALGYKYRLLSPEENINLAKYIQNAKTDRERYLPFIFNEIYAGSALTNKEDETGIIQVIFSIPDPKTFKQVIDLFLDLKFQVKKDFNRMMYHELYHIIDPATFVYKETKPPYQWNNESSFQTKRTFEYWTSRDERTTIGSSFVGELEESFLEVDSEGKETIIDALQTKNAPILAWYSQTLLSAILSHKTTSQIFDLIVEKRNSGEISFDQYLLFYVQAVKASKIHKTTTFKTWIKMAIKRFEKQKYM